MDTLTWIQLGGIVLSVAGGLLATFTDTRTDDKKGLTSFGYWAITLTAAGMICGVVGQVIANSESRNDTQSVLNDLQKQETNGLQTLSAVFAQLTKFDHVSAIGVFEVQSTNSIAKPLADAINRLADDGNAKWPSGIWRSSNIVFINPSDVTDSNWLAAVRPIHDFVVHSRFSFPIIGINKALRPGETYVRLSNQPAYDLNLNNESTNSVGKEIRFSLKDSCFHFDIPFESPSANDILWTSNGKVVGTSDLSGASLYVGLLPPLAESQLARCDIKFGNHLCTIDRFNELHSSKSRIYNIYESVLPEGLAIQNNQAYHWHLF